MKTYDTQVVFDVVIEADDDVTARKTLEGFIRKIVDDESGHFDDDAFIVSYQCDQLIERR